MRLDGFRASTNIEDRRDSGGGGGGGGRGRLGIIGIVVALVISYFTGISPQALLGLAENLSGGSGQLTQGGGGTGRYGTPNDANGKFVAQVLGATEDAWTELFRQQGAAYTPPKLIIFRDVTNSACGRAESAMGPFYCPGDKTIYLDFAFFDEMRSRYQACPTTEGACAFAQAYVIAHEVGHHVQNLRHALEGLNQARRSASSQAQANALTVQSELQADCLAGVWAGFTESRLHFIQRGDVEAALQTAAAIGDDTLQRRTQGRVVPDSFTHGSSAQRQRAFMMGFQGGQITSCEHPG